MKIFRIAFFITDLVFMFFIIIGVCGAAHDFALSDYSGAVSGLMVVALIIIVFEYQKQQRRKW